MNREAVRIMTFNEYRYERPDVNKIEQQFKELLESFTQAESVSQQNQVMETINQLRNEYNTQETLVSIRHSVDTRDEFYKAEQDYFDEINPVIQEYITDYYRALTQSKFRQELESKWGAQLFRLAEMSLKTFSPEIIEDLQQENKWITKYSQLIASAKITFEGEERTLAQLTPFELSTDRDMRHRASDARYQFMLENERELDQIYDDLVKVRTKIAKKLGYRNFVELGYARMNRTDYNAEMVQNFRDQVA
jgi:M3 family oligoendopeptidase